MVRVVRPGPFCLVSDDDGEVVDEQRNDSPPAADGRMSALRPCERAGPRLLSYHVKCVIFSFGCGGAIQKAAKRPTLSTSAQAMLLPFC